MKTPVPARKIPEDIEYYRRHLDDLTFLEGAEAVEFRLISLSGRTQTGCLTFLPTGRKIFVKLYFCSDSPAGSLLRTVEEGNPSSSYFGEKRHTSRIYNNVSPALVHRLLGSDDNIFFSSFEFLDHPSDRHKLLEAQKTSDKKGKLKVIYEGAKSIATFDGLVNRHSETFSADFGGTRHTGSIRLARLEDYLMRIIRYKHVQQGQDLPKDEDPLREWITKRYDPQFRENVRELVSLSGAFKEELVLQHGDCRVQHLFNGKLVDLELFGLHTQGYDLVTYHCAEGGISEPPVSELLNILAFYHLYERANRKEKGVRLREIGRLDGTDRSRFSELIPAKTLHGLFAQYLQLHLEENLRLDAANKRYSPELRRQVAEGIPNYTQQEMDAIRLRVCERDLELASDLVNTTSWRRLENASGMKKYFHHAAEGLLRYELVDLTPRVMEKLAA